MAPLLDADDDADFVPPLGPVAVGSICVPNIAI